MSDITKTQNNINLLETRLKRLKAQLKADHPNHCTACGGVGGSASTSGDGWHEPITDDWDDCEACLGQSLNPLDITESLIDDEVEDQGGHPILSEIHEVELNLHYECMYADHLEMEEAEHCWQAICKSHN
jgi:hypothetical protein